MTLYGNYVPKQKQFNEKGSVVLGFCSSPECLA